MRLRAIIISVAVAGVFGLPLLDDLYRTDIGNFIQGNAFWLAWLVPVLLVGVVSFVVYPGESASYDDRRDIVKKAAFDRRHRLSAIGGIATAVLLVLAVGMWIYQGVVHGYQVRRAIVANVEVTTQSAPTFKERAAFDVAKAQAEGNKGDIIGDIVDVTYAPDQDTFGALIERKGRFAGYVAVETQTVRKTGQATASLCTFDRKADARLGGNFGHNLERQIAHVRSGFIISARDAYGVCTDGKTPLVVVPLKNHKGWFPAIEVPAGVATYNGLTGEVKVYDHVKVGELPGPVFPITIAEDLREATAAMSDSWWDYHNNRSGYSDTSRDKNDPNGDNRSEFALATTDGVPAYVSPLTPRTGTTINAIGVVEGGSVNAGQFNKLVVHKLNPTRKANSAVADKLRTDYADLPGWSNGLRIFEIAPVSSTEWVASLGREQNVSYRVRIKADGTSCLEDADGAKIRCGGVSDVNGNGPGVAMAPNGTLGASPVAVPADGQLSKLSDADLAKLQQQLANEVARRLTAK